MFAVLRLFVLCLVALMVPLKGLAAVTMWACGPAHGSHAGHPAMVALAPSAHHAGHDAAAHDPVAHDHLAHGAADSGASAQDHAVPGPADAAGQAEADGTPTPCSACAPCCSPAAPAAEFLLPAAPPPQEAMLLAVLPLYGGVDTDVPHRPPRSLLA